MPPTSFASALAIAAALPFATLGACSSHATTATVPDLTGEITTFLNTEYPKTEWLVGGGGGGGGSGGLTGKTMHYEHAYQVRALKAPAGAEAVAAALQKFVDGKLLAMPIEITGRSTSDDSFGLTYKADGARGGVRVLVHDLAGGALEVSILQYEVF